MTRESGPLSGFRDMLADQMFPRQRMLETIKRVYESYGFTPLDTPALERYETLTGKYGEEGEKLMYKFTDHGGRNLAMRYDLTVPLARVVAQHRDKIPMPYKRYQVGNVWRGESPQAGRFREFMQFDADTVGTGSAIADAEVVIMMADTMQALGADALVRVNNRRILDALVEKSGVEPSGARFLISTIDKFEKIGIDEVLSQIREAFGDGAAKLTRDYLGVKGTAVERLKMLENLLGGNAAVQEGVNNLIQVFAIIEGAGYKNDQIVFDHTIARGLDYYTGIIYETTLKQLPRLGSVCSGGRFDNLVAQMGGPDLPAVGTSVGVDRLFTGLQELGQLESVKTQTQVMIVNFKGEDAVQYMNVATQLRREGVATEVYYDSDKLKKQLGFADKLGVKVVVIMGSNELEKGVATLKRLDTREQVTVPLSEVIQKIQEIIQAK